MSQPEHHPVLSSLESRDRTLIMFAAIDGALGGSGGSFHASALYLVDHPGANRFQGNQFVHAKAHLSDRVAGVLCRAMEFILSERLVQINSKVERAKHHVRYLQREIHRFFKTNPYKLGTKRDLQTREFGFGF